MALKAGVNANLLRRWIRPYEDRRGGSIAKGVVESTPTAFVPVVEIARADPVVAAERPAMKPKTLPAPTRTERMHASHRAPLASKLVAQLPNGVSLELECMGQDTALLKAMIDALRAR